MASHAVSGIGRVMMSDTNEREGPRFSNDKEGRMAFDAQRLRNIARLLNVESAIPQTDIELSGTVGAVCGIFYRKIKELQARGELEAKKLERALLEARISQMEIVVSKCQFDPLDSLVMGELYEELRAQLAALGE